jgi:small subunit ribosomal protein S4
VAEKSKKVQAIIDSLDAVVRRGCHSGSMPLKKRSLKAEIKSFPVREDLTLPMQEQLIVELYSK